ncbi:MAG: AbiJ N-terminal domain 4 [Candidatus Parcubacteria bacterium]|jgi:hypothetical protein
MELFSQRNLIKAKILNPQDMPLGLRTRIWNEIQKSLDDARIGNDRNDLIKKIWTDFFKKSGSELNGVTSYR